MSKQDPNVLRERRGVLAPRPFAGTLIKYDIEVMGRGPWGTRSIWCRTLSQEARELLEQICVEKRYYADRYEYRILDEMVRIIEKNFPISPVWEEAHREEPRPFCFIHMMPEVLEGSALGYYCPGCIEDEGRLSPKLGWLR